MSTQGSSTQGFGIDIGGTGIKGGIVDLESGVLVGERLRIPTPQPATPEAVAGVVKQILDEFGWDGPVGCALPAVVQQGVARSAANIDPSWIGTDAAALFTSVSGRPTTLLNDADAAGLAEVTFGAGRGVSGAILVATLGTGIGTALFIDGVLYPNAELGHVFIDGVDAETRAANSAREREELSWGKWAERLTTYFGHIENLIWPDLIIVGGGVSKKAPKWLPKVQTRAPIVPAQLANDAGIVGAARAAAR